MTEAQYPYPTPTPPVQPQEAPRDATADEVREDVEEAESYSHVLTLADGRVVHYSVDDMNPHAPVPTDIDGVPVVHVAPATVGGPA